LQIGNGGVTGSITGNVVNNATLTFDRSDMLTFAGVISGSGALTQIGSGTLVLTGANTYTGGTTISSGTLQIGNGGAIGSITGNVADNGTLAFDRSDTSTFAGVISRSGGLTQSGSGTLILTGANTYTGGTTIGAGTLQIGNGGTTGSITGNVVVNGTLAFDHSDTLTFAGVISGSGGVNQIGSGTTILTGTSSYTGPTVVNAGILDVNGSIATSALTVNGGGTLKGNGTVGSLTLATGATVAPGNSIGTLHVAGNANFSAGSIYSVEVNAAGQSDLIAATGAATISSGALVQITAAPGTYAAQTNYVILTAAGGVTGTFATPTVDLPFLVPQLIYQPTEVDLLLTIRDINLIPPAHTPNQIATAVAVKAGGLQSVIFGQFLQDSLNGLGFVTSALDQLSGEIHPSLVTAELEDSRLVQLSILARLRQAATGDASGTLAPAPAQAREIVDGVSMWTHAFADWGTLESDGNAAQLDQNLSGILAGIDARIGATNVGLAGGYSHSHANQRTSVATGDNTYIAAYGGWVQGAVALRAGGTYGWGNRNTLRTVVFPGFAETLTAKEDQHESQVFGEVAYAASMEHLSLEPFAGITWDDASTGAFAEQGGAAAVSGTGGDTSVAYSSLGVRLAAMPIGDDQFVLTPRAAVAWQHAFGGLHPGQVLTFEDTGQRFLALGNVIDSNSADVAVGFDARIGSGGTLTLGYEGILSSRVRLNTVHAGLSWNF
jgi:outer membrane autotransporter protein